MRVLIVADDLTGALDAAVPFADHRMNTCVLRDARSFSQLDLHGIDVCAVSTGSREGHADAALATIDHVLAALPIQRPEIIFKKVDSRLKGHVALETVRLASGTNREKILIAPAIPDMGRVVENRQITGMGIASPISIAGLFANNECDVAIPDTQSHADFHNILERFDPRHTLYTGARGLAAALAEKLGGSQQKKAITLPCPALFAIGSRDPITLKQVESLMNAQKPALIEAPNGDFPASHTLDARLTLTQLTKGAHEIAADCAGQVFADSLYKFIAENPPATLLACGGETASALFKRLSIERLDLVCEILPGVPLAEAKIGDKMTRIITKSGGFGDADTLLHLANCLKSVKIAPEQAGSAT